MKGGDWQPDPEFVRRVFEDLIPKVESSRIFLSLNPSDGGSGDVKFWIELGMAVMLDKPLIAVVPVAEHEKFRVPRKLRILADELVFAPDGVDNDYVREQLKDAFRRMGVPFGGD